ncbi:hypothetical protein KPH14_004229 [Odynerus spinipes]|uniref:DNA (cytosine-5-)-methyltransferase n=1 Tax=Odynerus spinipes TaxID=1348599 RepID=A0AAD9RYY8_9HYME|nr:hypothetical protein KPH14_004229 [Odynerus spinipes]
MDTFFLSDNILQVVTRAYNKENRSRTCVESNVWSVVCAMELGLLTESSLKNVSIRMLSDEVQSRTLPSSWPFADVGSDFKLEKKFVGRQTVKLRRQRKAKSSLSRKVSIKNKEFCSSSSRSVAIRNNRCNKKIENSLGSDSASEMSLEDEENNFRSSICEIIDKEISGRYDSPKTEDSFENSSAEYDFIPKVTKRESVNETKTSSSVSLEQDFDSFASFSSTLKINSNDCYKIVCSQKRFDSTKFEDLHDIPLVERLSTETIKEDTVCTVSTRSFDKNDPTFSATTLSKENHATVKIKEDSISNVSLAITETVTLVDDGAKKNDATKGGKENSFEKRKENETSWQNLRRITRGLTKISKAVNKENFLGRLVWGSCSGWWPAVIIDAEHAGMLTEPGKLWVYWIGDSLISLLNEKTQIEPFTNNLEFRLRQKSEVEGKMRAIDLTMQMMREKCGSLLTKPYHVWIKKYFIDENGHEMTFYPYPTKIQERLDFLREKNEKITEKYMLKQTQLHERKKKQAEKCNDSSLNGFKNLELLPLMEQQPGVIAWAKIAGHNWWPAMIVDYRDCCMREPAFGCQWIMWYGDYKLSEIHHRAFMKFDEGMEKMREYTQRTKKHLYLLGVLHASKDYYSRLGYDTNNWILADAFVRSSKVRSRKIKESSTLIERSEESEKYSVLILDKLNQLKINADVDNQRRDDIADSNILHYIKIGEVKINDICLRCLKISQDGMEQHPFFKGSLCNDCSELFKPCIFVIGPDGKCYYCTICAGSGTVVMCDNEDCPRVYCTACLKYLMYPDAYDNVLVEDPWKCMLCMMDMVSTSNGVILPRLDWKEKIAHVFRTGPNSSKKIANYNRVNRKMRVLSLFDGLSTGLLVLLKLGITIEVYYASEIDKDALTVSSSHFGDRIIYLGDVRGITERKIKEIAPIDLLMGGSPCNDLSLVNPGRLGLHDPNGTGILFFEYSRIMKSLKKANKGRHLFWLYENVASMPTKYRLEINRYLGQEPDVIDSADFSPQHRLRLYWHNLPIDANTLALESRQDVQDVLTPHCSRYALVKKIRTVTTKVNSLKQGKLALKPILMKDEADSLWITELEEIFGFPRHYTDVKNLSATKRQRLIGKSWSVQTLTAIFRSLRPIYEHN